VASFLEEADVSVHYVFEDEVFAVHEAVVHLLGAEGTLAFLALRREREREREELNRYVPVGKRRGLTRPHHHCERQ